MDLAIRGVMWLKVYRRFDPIRMVRTLRIRNQVAKYGWGSPATDRCRIETRVI